MNIRRTWPEIPGCEFDATSVKSISQGTVIYIGASDGRYVVNVQSNANECIRYCHLKSVSVKLNDLVSTDTTIGQADKYVRVEYCTTFTKNKYVVRVYDQTYYKQDPSAILSGSYDIISYQSKQVKSDVSDTIKLTSLQLAEFGNSRGDNIVEF